MPEETTGSIRRAEERLFADLGQEDQRRAKGVLALALDPQGNGKPAKWDNPDSRMAGEIAPTGLPYVEGDEICRKFRATVEPPSASPRSVEGHACRVSADDWAIRELRPVTKS